MKIHLTEEIIRLRANDQSFQRGREYYLGGAVYDPCWQSMPGGIVLMAYCEGSSAYTYRLRVELDAGGVRVASCTCPYDWGGDCKHIVALLLMYLHQHDEFSERVSLADLLAGLEKDELLALLTHLVQNNPDLYDGVELAIPAAKLAVRPKNAAQPNVAGTNEKRETQVSEPVYRKQIRRILKHSRYDYGEGYGEWDGAPGFLDDLENVQQTAIQFLEAGDADGALIILRALLEETLDEYDGEMDYNGDFASFIQSLGMPMAEAILSAGLDNETHQELQASMEELLEDLDEAIEESELEVILAALRYGWEELPSEETEASIPPGSVLEDLEEYEWMLLDELQQARLNVLERQGRLDEFLELAEKADPYRYTLKLLELGQVEAAIAAGQHLVYDHHILSVAKKLREAGRLKDAMAMAERGLNLKGNYAYELGAWLAPLEEAQGNHDMALLAYRAAFDAHASIELYRQIKRLSGPNWENLRPELQQKINPAHMPNILVEIHLEEGEWDAAITLAEKETWYGNLLEKVVDAVIPHRSDWVIETALKQSDALIVRTQSNLYPAAAQWLARAKRAYQHKGQAADWQAYITNLRAVYARRPALQRAIADL